MTPYDRVEYVSHPFVKTHPDRLSTVASLFRMRTAPVDDCRVLEIGCASGGNILPMADALPGSRFVGIDLSAVEIAKGAAIARELGLSNLELRHGDLREIDASWGEFDYIIAHGVYSWIPDDVKAALLDVVGARLAPNGVAMVSHHVKPGWYLRQLVRSMMRYHVAGVDDPAERVAQARALVEFLVESTDDSYWRAVLQRQAEAVQSATPDAIYHDWLADVNDACLFHELVADAERRGLMFLSDAEFATMVPKGYSRATSDTLDKLGASLVEHEQYHDFVRGRTFRMTLLVRASVDLDRHVTGAALRDLWITSRARPNPVDGGRTFHAPPEISIEVKEPAMREALLHLASIAPGAAKPAAIAEVVSARLGHPVAPETLLADFLARHAAAIVELSIAAPRFTPAISERPRVAPFARLQARRGAIATNRRHEIVRLAPGRQALVALLDGTRDRLALAAATGLDPAAVDVQLAALAQQAMLTA
jgi:trans-aconitate methyltransferase